MIFQETFKEYESISAADLLETIRMEFSELKAEAFSSLSMLIFSNFIYAYCKLSLVEVMMEPSLYFAQELDEAVQV